jgi:hypothetical protein
MLQQCLHAFKHRAWCVCANCWVFSERLEPQIPSASGAVEFYILYTFFHSCVAVRPLGRNAYAIIGYDAAKHMVIVRNPHGKNSERFALANDPHHEQFEQLADGDPSGSLGRLSI